MSETKKKKRLENRASSFGVVGEDSLRRTACGRVMTRSCRGNLACKGLVWEGAWCPGITGRPSGWGAQQGERGSRGVRVDRARS